MRTLTLVLLTAVVAVGCGKKPEPTIDTSPAPKDRPRFPPKVVYPAPEPARTDEQKAQGVWKVVAVESPPGDPTPPKAMLDDVRFVVKDGLLTVASLSKKRFDDYFTFKGDSAVSPKTVDFTPCDEKGVALPGERIMPGQPLVQDIRLGLYKFEGEELVVAVAVESHPKGYRPTEFKAALTRRSETNQQHSMVVVLRLKKADPGEAITPNPPKGGGPGGDKIKPPPFPEGGIKK